jgi:hypothetical protein
MPYDIHPSHLGLENYANELLSKNGRRHPAEAARQADRYPIGLFALLISIPKIYPKRASITAITCAPFQNAARWKV